MTGRRFPPPLDRHRARLADNARQGREPQPLVGTSVFGRHSGGEFPDVAISAKPLHLEGHRPLCYVPASAWRPVAVIVSQITLIGRWEGPIRTVPGVALASPLPASSVNISSLKPCANKTDLVHPKCDSASIRSARSWSGSSPPRLTAIAHRCRLFLPVRPRVGADHVRHSASADGLGSDFPDIHAPTPFRGIVPTPRAGGERLFDPDVCAPLAH
jgi:hypothetical protein